ncbi:MAG: hypothetical protein ACO3IJ_01105, partial [Steroidobacteraceae bacterium]
DDEGIGLDHRATLTEAGGETNPLLYTAIYEDDYRKVEGRWLFSRIRIHLLWPQRTLTGPLQRVP